MLIIQEAVMSVSGAVFAPFTGYLGDRFGRRWVYLISLALWGVGSMWFGVQQTLFGVIFTRSLSAWFPPRLHDTNWTQYTLPAGCSCDSRHHCWTQLVVAHNHGRDHRQDERCQKWGQGLLFPPSISSGDL